MKQKKTIYLEIATRTQRMSLVLSQNSENEAGELASLNQSGASIRKRIHTDNVRQTWHSLSPRSRTKCEQSASLLTRIDSKEQHLQYMNIPMCILSRGRIFS